MTSLLQSCSNIYNRDEKKRGGKESQGRASRGGMARACQILGENAFFMDQCAGEGRNFQRLEINKHKGGRASVRRAKKPV